MNSVNGMASTILSTQDEHFKKLDEDSKDAIKKIHNEMINGAQSLEDNANNLENKLTSFEKDFTESLETEYAKIREHHRKQYIKEFLNRHFHSYDVALYEADRQKSMDKSHHRLPDYMQFDALRKKAIQCHIERHNFYEQIKYKNTIAQLKVEHKDKHIKFTQKPNYWKWPLTEDQLADIYLHPVPVFSVITLGGQCNYA
jgi:hypothetical protein